MHWILIVLIIIACAILYATGVGISIGLLKKFCGWTEEDDSVFVVSGFFWWAIVPTIIFGLIVKFVSHKISGN